MSQTASQYNYSKEWLADSRILCYRVHDTAPRTIDGWASDLEAEFSGWPVDRPWRLMLSLVGSGTIINPYALTRARKIAAMRPDIGGRLALVVSSRLAAQVVNVALRNTVAVRRQRLVFSDEARAVRWLLAD